MQECDSLHHLHDFRSLLHKASLGCIAIVFRTKLTLSKSSLSYGLLVLAPHNMERQGPRSACGPSPQEHNAQRHNYPSQQTASVGASQLHGDAAYIAKLSLEGIVLPAGLKKRPLPLVEFDSSFLMRVGNQIEVHTCLYRCFFRHELSKATTARYARTANDSQSGNHVPALLPPSFLMFQVAVFALLTTMTLPLHEVNARTRTDLQSGVQEPNGNKRIKKGQEQLWMPWTRGMSKPKPKQNSKRN